MAPRDQLRRISQHARLDRGGAQPLTRTGLDWTHKYRAIAAAMSALPAKQAYLDGELCGITPDGKTSFSLIQTASDSGHAAALVFFSCSTSSTSMGRWSWPRTNSMTDRPCRKSECSLDFGAARWPQPSAP